VPERRSPLTECRKPGLHGATPAEGPGIAIRESAPLSAVQVAAFDEEKTAAALVAAIGIAPPRAQNTVTVAGETRILWIGPARWMVVERETRGLAELLARHCPPEIAAVTDLGHARTAISIEGRAVRSLLSKLCTLDVDPAAFPVGSSAQMLMGQIGILLHCRAKAAFDLFVYRGFAASAWETILDAALEFGCEVR